MTSTSDFDKRKRSLLQSCTAPRRVDSRYRRSRALIAVLGVLVECVALAGPLHEAVRSGDAAKVLAVIDAVPDALLERNNDADTALHVGVRMGCVPIVDALLRAGVDVNVLNKNGISPERLAEGLGRHEIAAMITARGGPSQRSIERSMQSRRPDAIEMVDADGLLRPAIVTWPPEERRHRSQRWIPAPPQVARATLPVIWGAIRPGQNEIRIYNPTLHMVEVGIRCGTLGRNMVVHSGGTAIARLAEGHYDIYFAFDDGSGVLWKGDPVRFSGHKRHYEVNTITLTKTPKGNYSIHPVTP